MSEQDLVFHPGERLALNLEGQEAVGEVVEMRGHNLVMRVPVRYAAQHYSGLIGRAALPDGRELRFDLGAVGHFVMLEVEIPLVAHTEPIEAAPPVERRKFYRLACELDLEVLESIGITGGAVRKGFGAEIVKTRGRTVNLSGGGLMAALDQPLMPGLYTVRIHMPQESVTVSAKVLRKPLASPVFSAMEFVNIHELDRSKIIRMIFNRMRHVRDKSNKEPERIKTKRTEGPSRHAQRREKYYSPPKIRYW
ncbi:MAG: PilZ domain-containing protein [Candidatus Sericytochromatia bacterium]|nr:PilZ domain-containing protein [Candidatus Sericytochromatia bacterium]